MFTRYSQLRIMLPIQFPAFAFCGIVGQPPPEGIGATMQRRGILGRQLRSLASLLGVYAFLLAPARGQKPSPADQPIAELRKAAESGNADGQYMLGYRYETGTGVKQDYAQATGWYLKSAEQGYAAAQYSLGFLYIQNQGVSQDFGMAYFWLSIAASAYSGEPEGSIRRLRIASARETAAARLTKTRLEELQEQVDQFLVEHPRPY